MTRSSHRAVRRFPGASQLLLSVLMTAAIAAPLTPVYAQSGKSDPAALRAQVERRFDVLPLREGLVLRPKTSGPVRSIEITGGTIALDGQAVTGAELRSRLAADADLVLQLSYLDEAQRRALFAIPGATGAQPTPAPTTPSQAEPPASPPPPPAPTVAPPAPPEPPRPSRRSRTSRRGDVVRFGGSVTVDDGETIPGDVVVIGGAAHVKGSVTGDVVVVGGSLNLGPQADIGGDAVVVGGALHRDPGAHIGGEVREVAVGPLNVNWRGPGRGLTRWWGDGFRPAFSLVATLVRVGVLCLLAALVVLFARDYTDRVESRAVAEPLKAGAVGLLAQVLFFPVLIVTVVLFAVTIIGIPLLLLLPFAVLGLVIFALAGFTAVATHAGRLITARFGWTQYGAIATTVIGVLTVASPVILGRLVGVAGGPLWILAMGLLVLGFVAEYLAWTIGIGAVALTRFSRGFPGGSTVTGPVGPFGPTPRDPLGPPSDSVSPA